MKKSIKGGEFLIKEIDYKNMFIPEEWDEEQKMIAQTCFEFLNAEIFPNLDRIDALEEGLMPSLIDKSGELGMLGVSIPEKYGGFGKDFTTSMLVTEALGGGYSFAVAFAAHTGIGTLPILYYGNEAQKEKYVTKLATGEWKGAYCLTEPGAGSDANSGKTKAVLSEDGTHYILNGQKMWITNGGFADIFTVFAKIDDDDTLSAFIVEANSEGVSLNPEEKKMGIKGSSTRQVFFNNVKVPKENHLGQREEGFKIALNILNLGRIKLGGATLGGSKLAINKAINYANEREQFGRSISKYGAIRYKIAEQVIRTFAVESAIYRCSKDIDYMIEDLMADGMDKQKALLKSAEEYAAEAAIIKVYSSEVLDYVVDEAVQIYGGMGYSAESPVERSYRDSRINRIFEGTNEINRMLTVDMILKRAMKGKIDLMGPAMKVADELMSIPDFGEDDGGKFDEAYKVVKNFKKAVLMVAGAAAQKLMTSLAKEQEVLINIANMVNETYVAESLLYRVQKINDTRGDDGASLYMDILNTFLLDAADRVNKNGKDALMSFADDDELNMMLMGMKRFTKIKPFNMKEARQRIAKKVIDDNEYSL